MQATRLRAGLWMLEGEGGNVTASIGRDGVFVVDTGLASTAPALLDALRRAGGAEPRFVVNTHFHYDHTGGNPLVGRTATIIAPTAVRARLMTPQRLWHQDHPAQPPEAWPTITFDDALTLHLNDDDITVEHVPGGHTDGDAVVLFRAARVASLGDLYFAGMYPIWHPEHGGSLVVLVEDLQRVLTQLPDDALVVPGHGPLARKADLARYGVASGTGVAWQAVSCGTRLAM